MGDLMDGGGYRLHLAHALPQRDALGFGAEIAVHLCGQRLELHRHGRGAAQRLHERSVVFHVSGQVGDGTGHALRQGLSVRLGVVEHLDRAEHGDFNLLFLGNDFAVRVQNGQLGVRVELFLLDFLLIRRGRDDGDALLAPQHMAGELVPPAVVARHKCGVRALQVDERLIVEGIVVKPAHGAQVIAVLFHIAGFKDVADTRLDAVGDLLELFSVFTGLLWHRFLLSSGRYAGAEAPAKDIPVNPFFRRDSGCRLPCPAHAASTGLPPTGQIPRPAR